MTNPVTYPPSEDLARVIAALRKRSEEADRKLTLMRTARDGARVALYTAIEIALEDVPEEDRDAVEWDMERMAWVARDPIPEETSGVEPEPEALEAADV